MPAVHRHTVPGVTCQCTSLKVYVMHVLTMIILKAVLEARPAEAWEHIKGAVGEGLDHHQRLRRTGSAILLPCVAEQVYAQRA